MRRRRRPGAPAPRAAARTWRAAALWGAGGGAGAGTGGGGGRELKFYSLSYIFRGNVIFCAPERDCVTQIKGPGYPD